MFGTLYFFTLLGLVAEAVGDLTYVLVDPRIDFEARAGLSDGRAGSHRATARRAGRRAVAAGGAPARQLPGQPARLCLGSGLPRPVRDLAVRRADRQRPAAAGPLRRRASTSRCFVAYPETDVRRLLRDRGRLPRSRRAGADRGEGLDRSGRRSPTATTPSCADLPAPAPSPPTAPELARHRRPGARRAGAAHLRLPHLGPVRPGADRPELGRRRRRRRGAGLFRRLGRPVVPALHRDLGRPADRSIC